jgi:hypothetical protein
LFHDSRQWPAMVPAIKRPMPCAVILLLGLTRFANCSSAVNKAGATGDVRCAGADCLPWNLSKPGPCSLSSRGTEVGPTTIGRPPPTGLATWLRRPVTTWSFRAQYGRALPTTTRSEPRLIQLRFRPAISHLPETGSR